MSNPNYKKESSDNYSLIGTAGLRELLEPLIGGMNIEDFPIPFRATASGMTSGEEVELSSGSAIEAVLATIAVPGVFPSRNYDDNVLVDGAVLNPIPVATARNIKSSLPIVAVVLHRTDVPMEPGDGYLKLYDGLPGEIAKGFTRTKIGETIRTFAKSMLMINDKLAELSLQVNEPDVIVDPKVGHFDMLQLVDPEELERLGYEAMQAKLMQLEEACSLLNTYRRISRYTSAKKD